MKIQKVELGSQISDFSYIALGNFDGVHIGHKELIDTLVKESKEKGVLSSVLIFREHTKNIISGKKQELLTSTKLKYEILEQIGVDIVYEMEFNETIMKLSPEEFIKDFLSNHLKVQGIIVGFDYRFGHKARGDVNLLESLCKDQEIHLFVIDPVKKNGGEISSTRIRNLVREGEIKEANSLLGRAFAIDGRVVKGKGLGRKLGVPTANLEMNTSFIVPKLGVYSGKVIVGEDTYLAAINIGKNPTFDQQDIRLEAYLLDFSGDLYGKYLKVQLEEYLRPEMKFSDLEGLVEQMNTDIKKVRQLSK